MFNDDIDCSEQHPEALPLDKAVHRLFEIQAAVRGGGTALVEGLRKISYKDLNIRANRLAHWLIGEGFVPGQAAGIFLERGIEHIIVTLAVLKAGGVYVPIDTETPESRVRRMLQDVELFSVFSDSRSGHDTAMFSEVRAVDLASLATEIENAPENNPDVECSSNASAYIMFTSGTTGRPKGVEVLHKGVVRLFVGADYVPYSRETAILHVANTAFDAATFEIWGSLLNGGRGIICPHRVPTLRELKDLLHQNGVNTLLLTTAYFNLIVDESPEVLRPVKHLLVGGEALSAPHVEKALKALPDLNLINAYGPTENSVITTAYAFCRETFKLEAPVPIGRAINQTCCYILNAAMHPVEDGEEGELYAGGDGVARGYVNRPELTAEKFIPDPFSDNPEAVMYRTGDRVRRNADGQIEYLGRTDNQVKLRGHRIELQEIESVLSSCSGTEQVAVAVDDKSYSEKKLIAYVKRANAHDAAGEELRHYAEENLPDYMVPAFYVLVDAFPLTAAGKLDRRALPKMFPVGQAGNIPQGTIENEVQRELIDIFQDLFGHQDIGPGSDFFRLGGNSLMAVTLVMKIEQRTGCRLPLAVLTQASAIADLAEKISASSNSEFTVENRGFRALKELKSGDGSVPPLFLVHGGAGNVLLFSDFVQALKDGQPVYAFQWPGWADGAPGPETIGDMAAFYLEELTALYPQGELYLGGYCIGGLIAMEMAQKLKVAGRKVSGPLLVWDTPNLSAASRLLGNPWDSDSGIDGFNRTLKELLGYAVASGVRGAEPLKPASGKKALVRKIPGVLPAVRAGQRFVRTRKAAMDRKKLSSTLCGGPVPVESRAALCMDVLLRAAEKYRFREFECDVLYFKSMELSGHSFGLGAGWWCDPFLGFRELCKGHFTGGFIGGEHNGMACAREMADLFYTAGEKLKQDVVRNGL